MKRFRLSIFLLTSLCSAAQAQNITSKKWNDLFSYSNVLKICGDGNRMIAATENGLFRLNPSTPEVSKISKASGLHQVKITAFDYDEKSKTGLVGYKDGSMDVLTKDGIFYIYDIPVATGFTGDKRINHISINGTSAVVSTQYGLSVFDLKKREFKDTAFFKNGSQYDKVYEAALYNGKVYAATDKGLLSHDLDAVTFSVYATWETALSGAFYNVETKDNLLAAATGSQIYLNSGGGFAQTSQTYGGINDVSINDDAVMVTEGMRLHRLTMQGYPVLSTTVNSLCNTSLFESGTIYGGTRTEGIKKEDLSTLKPDGPYSNISYRVRLLDDRIYISGGGRSNYNYPFENNLGFYYFDGKEWQYPEMFLTPDKRWNVLDVAANPSKPEEIWFVNYVFSEHKGVYKTKNLLPEKHVFGEGSAFHNRVTGLKFSPKKDLIVSAYLLDDQPLSQGLLKFPAGSDAFTLIPVSPLTNNTEPAFYKNTVAMAAPHNTDGGISLFQYPDNNTVSATILKKANNLPDNRVICSTFDNDGTLWIGSTNGLRILPKPESEIGNPSPEAQPIVITQNNIGEELFRNSAILDIEVDGGNRKWISVDNGGVFYVSADGKTTYQQFNASNSPLPNNSITDISVDSKTGKVYFASYDGVVVYQGDVEEVKKDFGNVMVYPNPHIARQHRPEVRLKGLAERTNIRITDAAGYIVHTGISTGGTYTWNLMNMEGKKVASGMYFILMTNEDGTDTATAKLAVIN